MNGDPEGDSRGGDDWMEVRLEFAGVVTREQVGSMYGGEDGIHDGSVEYFPWNTDAVQGERMRGGRPGAAGTG